MKTFLTCLFLSSFVFAPALVNAQDLPEPGTKAYFESELEGSAWMHQGTIEKPLVMRGFVVGSPAEGLVEIITGNQGRTGALVQPRRMLVESDRVGDYKAGTWHDFRLLARSSGRAQVKLASDKLIHLSIHPELKPLDFDSYAKQYKTESKAFAALTGEQADEIAEVVRKLPVAKVAQLRKVQPIQGKRLEAAPRLFRAVPGKQVQPVPLPDQAKPVPLRGPRAVPQLRALPAPKRLQPQLKVPMLKAVPLRNMKKAPVSPELEQVPPELQGDPSLPGN